MRKSYFLNGEEVEIKDLPFDVLVCWLGHELGHIMDYFHRKVFSLFLFGFGYVLFPNFRRRAEYTADAFAVKNGMLPYLQATKGFILKSKCFTEVYKAKIKKYYVSPEDLIIIPQEC